MRLGACCGEAGCCRTVELGTWARGDCWKVAGLKALSGVEELRVMGGPRSASRCGLLLWMEEEEEDGGVVVVRGGAAEGMDGVRHGSSWLGAGPVYGGLSNSPTNSMSWLLMSCSMSAEVRNPNQVIHQVKNESCGSLESCSSASFE